MEAAEERNVRPGLTAGARVGGLGSWLSKRGHPVAAALALPVRRE